MIVVSCTMHVAMLKDAEMTLGREVPPEARYINYDYNQGE